MGRLALVYFIQVWHKRILFYAGINRMGVTTYSRAFGLALWVAVRFTGDVMGLDAP